MTIKGKDYRVYIYEDPVAKIENALVIISYENDGDGFKKPMFLLSIDIELDAKSIIEHYSKRWTIETNYKYLKNSLGFDKYRVRSLISIERYFLIVFLAMNFLETIKVLQSKLLIKTIGEAIEYQRRISAREFVSYIYHQAKKNVAINDIYVFLKIA